MSSYRYLSKNVNSHKYTRSSTLVSTFGISRIREAMKRNSERDTFIEGSRERFPIRVQILSRRTHAFRDVDKHGYRRCEFTVRSIRRSVDRNTR